MKTCAICLSPNVPNGYRHPYCSYGCYGISGFIGPTRVASLTILIISLLLYLASILLAHFPDLLIHFSVFEIYWARFSLSVVLLVILGFPILRYLICNSLRSGYYLQPELLLLIAVGLDFIISLVYQDSFLQTESKFGFGQHPFYLSGLLLLIYHLLAYFEAYARKKALDDYSSLKRAQVVTARVKTKEITEVVTHQVKPGDIVVVEEGQLIPCDGEIVKGATSVDESVFLAERRILFKKIGDSVLGGSLNRDSEIQIVVRQPVENHFLPRILSHLNEAYDRAYRSQKGLDYFFLTVLLLLLIYINSPLFFAVKFSSSVLLSNTLSIFLVFAFFNLLRILPMLYVICIGRCSLYGILIQSPAVFKPLARLKGLVVNKTGVLTDGQYAVSQWFINQGVNQGEMLSILFSLEQHAQHPIAKGMASHPWYHEVQKFNVTDFKEFPGLGICGKVWLDKDRYTFAAVGNMRFLKRHQMFISKTIRQRLDDLETVGESAVLCGWNKEARGVFGMADNLRQDVPIFLHEAVGLGLKPILVTGDHEQMLTNLNYTKGLQDMFSRCLPVEKKKKIQSLRERGLVTGFVGDPLEDDHVITEANVGMIFGTGPRLLDKSAQVYFLGTQLNRITRLIMLSKKLYRTIRFNFCFGLVYVVMTLYLSLTGLLNPLATLMTMVVGSIFLLSNALRLKLFRIKDGHAS